jgi:hypothetical protein
MSETLAEIPGKDTFLKEETAHIEHAPLDLDDPHRAALEDNPDHRENLSLPLILAVIVRAIIAFCGSLLSRLYFHTIERICNGLAIVARCPAGRRYWSSSPLSLSQSGTTLKGKQGVFFILPTKNLTFRLRFKL